MQYNFSQSDYIASRSNPDKIITCFKIDPNGFTYVKKVIQDAFDSNRRSPDIDIDAYIKKYANDFNTNLISRYSRVCRTVAYRLSNALKKYDFIHVNTDQDTRINALADALHNACKKQ